MCDVTGHPKLVVNFTAVTPGGALPSQTSTIITSCHHTALVSSEGNAVCKEK